MNKKNLFFVSVAVVLCAICSSCKSDTNYYLRWNPSVIFGDAAVQTSMIDSVCMVEAAASNYAVSGERILKLNTTDKADAKEKMKSFGEAVEKRLIETKHFRTPDIDENGDFCNQTCYINYDICVNVSRSTDNVKMKSAEVLKYGFIYK